MIAMMAKEFGQSPYDYLTGDFLKVSIDRFCYSLLVEQQTDEHNRREEERIRKGPNRPQQ